MLTQGPPRIVAIVLLVMAGVFGATVALFAALLIVAYGYQDYGIGVLAFILVWALAIGLMVVMGMRMWKRLPSR